MSSSFCLGIGGGTHYLVAGRFELAEVVGDVGEGGDVGLVDFGEDLRVLLGDLGGVVLDPGLHVVRLLVGLDVVGVGLQQSQHLVAQHRHVVVQVLLVHVALVVRHLDRVHQLVLLSQLLHELVLELLSKRDPLLLRVRVLPVILLHLQPDRVREHLVLLRRLHVPAVRVDRELANP